MSNPDADHIARLEAEVNALRTEVKALYTVMDRLNQRAGFPTATELAREGERTAPKSHARPGKGEVIPLRRRAR